MLSVGLAELLKYVRMVLTLKWTRDIGKFRFIYVIWQMLPNSTLTNALKGYTSFFDNNYKC